MRNALRSRGVSGAFAELGVYRGDASRAIHTAAPERRLYLFDTFDGFPAQDLAGPDGQVPDVTLAAASLAGITEVYRAGGAQAVAALAYGTESIGAVDKIFGPGNRYVTAAKLAVNGRVGIDMPAGPSELFRRAMRMMRFASSADNLRCLSLRFGRVGLFNWMEKGMMAKI